MSVIFSRVKHSAVQTSACIQITMANVAKHLRAGANKVLDFVLPRNEMTNRREVRFIPVRFEKWIGASIYDSACPRVRISKDEVLNAKVKEVFEKLVAQCPRKNLDWEVRVLEDDKVVNAFCAPGGKVVITTALIKKMNEKFDFDDNPEFANLAFEDNLAAVLGHEIVHAAAGHSARKIQLSILAYIVGKICSFVIPVFLFKRKENATTKEDSNVDAKRKAFSNGFDMMFKLANYLFKQKHSQCHELESDKWGIKLAHQAGYNVDASIRLQQIFLNMQGKKDGDKSGKLEKVIEVVASHPPSQVRLDANRKIIKDIKEVGLEKAFA